MLYFESAIPATSGSVAPVRPASAKRSSLQQVPQRQQTRPQRQQTTRGSLVDSIITALRSASAGRGD